MIFFWSAVKNVVPPYPSKRCILKLVNVHIMSKSWTKGFTAITNEGWRNYNQPVTKHKWIAYSSTITTHGGFKRLNIAQTSSQSQNNSFSQCIKKILHWFRFIISNNILQHVAESSRHLLLTYTGAIKMTHSGTKTAQYWQLPDPSLSFY